jgi:hypothetical protein
MIGTALLILITAGSIYIWATSESKPDKPTAMGNTPTPKAKPDDSSTINVPATFPQESKKVQEKPKEVIIPIKNEQAKVKVEKSSPPSAKQNQSTPPPNNNPEPEEQENSPPKPNPENKDKDNPSTINEWKSNKRYFRGDKVTYLGLVYVAVHPNVGKEPDRAFIPGVGNYWKAIGSP